LALGKRSFPLRHAEVIPHIVRNKKPAGIRADGWSSIGGKADRDWALLTPHIAADPILTGSALGYQTACFYGVGRRHSFYAACIDHMRQSAGAFFCDA